MIQMSRPTFGAEEERVVRRAGSASCGEPDTARAVTRDWFTPHAPLG
jgi:hypothetical protein